MKDRHGGTGRQTAQARFQTLRAFFDIVREPASNQQKAEDIDKRMANRAHGFDTASDRQACGYGERPASLRLRPASGYLRPYYVVLQPA
ncbi:hypothetical protein FHS02_005546 [Massilia umbonata]|uniref:Uncharacterized protein n=1 Tax=Pseudoduganella umbonata TaxID=864828 RepID=A0A4P8HWW0_9BURK|nr:hypothetical protein [Pseudoduganella umbonata]MBB3224681.1 hypothetical protein [Pseudoduganella umbonata]QCP13432.1 hypothetical protein FCL38_25595 [Pseudoduganella umbonata]